MSKFFESGKQHGDGSQTNIQTTTYHYDAMGRQTATTAQGMHGADTHGIQQTINTTYHFDAQGHLMDEPQSAPGPASH